MKKLKAKNGKFLNSNSISLIMKDAPKPPSVEDVSEMIRTAFQNAGSNPGGSNLEAGLERFGRVPVSTRNARCPDDDYELPYTEVVHDYYR